MPAGDWAFPATRPPHPPGGLGFGAGVGRRGGRSRAAGTPRV